MGVRSRFASVTLFALVCTSGTLAADSSLDIASIAGVYKHSFENGDVQGERYRSEDILEIVEISPKTAYFRTHLEFFNGHLCTLYGVAESERNSLVFRDPQVDGEGHQCVLRIEKTADSLVFHEDDKFSACKWSNCGMRGIFEGEKFALGERRTIRYMKRLLASQEYLETVSAYSAAHGPSTR